MRMAGLKTRERSMRGSVEAAWRRATLYAMAGGLFASVAWAAPMALRVDQRTNPLGIDSTEPSLSWRSDATARNWRQQAYEIEVASSGELLHAGKADVWDSGRVASMESVGLPYRGPALRSGTRYFWQVRTWDAENREERSAEMAWWEMGLLRPEDWTAQWISHDDTAERAVLARVQWLWLPGEDALQVAGKTEAEFRTTVHFDTLPETAVLHLLSGGTYTTTVNGKETGHKEEWGAFDREDVRSVLKAGVGAAGDNEIVVRTAARNAKAPNTVAQAVAAMLELREHGGRVRQVVSDAGWQARRSGGDWKTAQVVGGLHALRVSVGSDRREMMPAPERVSSGVSLMRSGFTLRGRVRSARLYVTAMGAYRAFLNGQRVGDAELTPGFTDFRKRVLYQTYDVTAMVHPGRNVMGAMLGAGWHGSPLLWAGIREFQGPDLLRAQLDVTLADGSHTVVVSDRNWRSAEDATDSSEIYGGETYDAREAQPQWNTVGFAMKTGWAAAKEQSVPAKVAISAQPDLPVHVSQQLQPVSARLLAATNGQPADMLFDMGQNMVGVVKLRVRGARGTTIRLQFAERLKPDGSVYTENLRNADATDEYTLRGGVEEVWTPAFTFHGFRYVQVSGLPAGAGKETLEGEVMNSLPDKPALRFSSSSSLLNSMFDLGLWGQRGNFFSVPTDCPQRDERMGWMGDAGVFWRTGSYNFAIDSFTHKFMEDVTDAQTPAGAFANISPNLLQVGPEAVGAPGWGDAGVLVPYATWMQYGDRGVIDRNWDAMERWLHFIESTNPDHLRQKELGPNYADWLAPDPNTPPDLVATAYWALITQQMETMAQATGRADASKRYAALTIKIRDAFRTAFVEDDGTVAGGTQTAYVLALYAGMAKQDQRHAMTDRLVASIEEHGTHLTTGFLGTPFLLFVLDTEGRSDVAYRLLLSDTYPSWGYMVSKGATTWWERWNGDTGDPGMNSYNHYAFGSVMAWVYRRVSGIDTDAQGAGFHHLVIAPHTDPKLTHARTEYESVYGTIITDWTRGADDGLQLAVTIPANTTATVTLPAGPKQSVSLDDTPLMVGNATATAEIGAGTYHFALK